ncbi:MAG: phosphoribosylformylglycinamidine synthase subunit PurL [Candidatus Eisenbacteria bacterium]|nr:phosphoribosylformylglycinamidine synthase subunit PurL [Candidatus Eisenbacteria bacterium]
MNRAAPRPHEPIGLQTADVDELAQRLRSLGLRMSPDEAGQILERVGRDLTFAEAAFFDVAWSEHCSYKSSRLLLKRHLPPLGPSVILGPGEDAGVVHLGTHAGREVALVVAHESHNHPSQVVPIEGAATGVGGIVRDVYCMGADVVGVLDQLRFGDPEGPARERVIEIARGVVTGIWEYGNALGVPNQGGDTAFDAAYDENCLVNVVALGVVPRAQIIRSRVPDAARREPFDIILVGKPTDSSGMGGAAFASRILDPEREAEERGAVQIHDPFLKRVLVASTRRVWEVMETEGWEAGFKDLGAGGLGGASSELVLAGGMGARIDLDRVPLSEADLGPETVLCAETQERFVWAVPRRVTEEVLRIYNEEYDLPRCYPGAGATVVGEVVPGGDYQAFWQGKIVVDLARETLADPPALERPREARTVVENRPEPPVVDDWQGAAEWIAGDLDVCCREWIYRHYDSEVRGAAVLRPGDAESCLLTPIPGSPLGVAVAVGGNHHLCRLHPRAGAQQAVAEAVRHLIAVGAQPIALTDGLNFGNPEDPHVLWDFEETLIGMKEACLGLGPLAPDEVSLPIVSGNVSFYNESSTGHAIPPTPLVAAYGRIESAGAALPNRAWEAGQEVLLVRGDPGSLGGSTAARVLGIEPGRPWSPRWDEEVAMARGVLKAQRMAMLVGCRDISQGGLLEALCELLFHEDHPPRVGVELVVGCHEPHHSVEWFLAEGTGYVAIAPAGDGRDVAMMLRDDGVPAHCLGRVTARPELNCPMHGGDDLQIDLTAVWERWRRRLGAILR